MGSETLESFNVPRDVLDSINDLVGRQNKISMATMVQVEVKGDKVENRVLTMTDCRLFILYARTPTKIEQSISYLDILAIESKSPSKLSFSLEGRKLNLSLTDDTRTDRIIFRLQEALCTAFPRVPFEKLVGSVDLSPPARVTAMKDQLRENEKREPGPCGGFVASYHFMCDYHNLPFMEDVAWDVETIYVSHDIRELSLGDFDHLDSRHQVPIIAALEYNTWFTSINGSNVKMNVDTLNEIVTVLRRNSTLEQLHLSGVGLKGDFIQKLSNAIASNVNSALNTLDLSHNPLDDRGLAHLSTPFRKLPKGLASLNLAKTGLTARGINRLAEALCENRYTPTSLQVLDLSNNSLRAEEITNLYSILAQPNALTTLNLASTDIAIEMLFGALLRGCCQHLADLDLSHNCYSSGRKASLSREPNVPQTWKQFLSSTLALRSLNIADCRLHPEVIKCVLLAIGSNPSCPQVELNISSNSLGVTGAQLLEPIIASTQNLVALDISDNGFDVSLLGLIPSFAKNKCLKKLHIGKNFNKIQPKNMSQVLEFLVEMIQDEECSIECLSLAGSRLKSMTTVIINALGANQTLTNVDLSDNQMGDVGARMLAKALLINTKLQTVHWDHNNTSPQGFQDIAQALNRNYSLKQMPLPVNDALIAMKANQEKTDKALKKIEICLQRNHSPRKFASDQAFRLKQSFLVNSLQQLVDKSIVSIRDTIQQLEKAGVEEEEVEDDIVRAEAIIKDAQSSRQLLIKCQDVTLRAEKEGDILQDHLENTALELQRVMERQIRKNVRTILQVAEDQCPTVIEDEQLRSFLKVSSREESSIPKNFAQTLLMEQLATDVCNKVGEVNLAVATQMSDQVIDTVLDELESSQKALNVHVKALSGKEDDSDQGVLRRSRDKDSHAHGVNTLENKRKSVCARKLRPQSAIAELGGREVATDDDDDGDDDFTEGSPADSPFHSGASTPSRSAPKFVKSHSMDNLVELPPLKTAPRLEHLGKNRPKRHKTRAISRPVVQLDSLGGGSGGGPTEADSGKALDGFFETKSVKRDYVAPDSSAKREPHHHVNNVEDSKSSPKHEATKKGWSPFGGKGDNLGLASGISHFFKKSPSGSKSPERTLDEPLKARTSPDVSKRTVEPRSRSQERELEVDDQGSGEEREKDEVQKTPPTSRRPLVPAVGLGGGGGAALMAEMRAKRETMRPKPADSDPVPVGRTRLPPASSSSSSSSSSPSHSARDVVDKSDTPVPMPRSSSPAKQEAKGLSSVKMRPPPPVAPKPRKSGTPTSHPAAAPATTTPAAVAPSAGTNGRPSSTVISTSKAQLTRGYSDAIDEGGLPAEKASASPRGSSPARDGEGGSTKRRLSVREAATMLDKNSNEKPDGIYLKKETAQDNAGNEAPKSYEHLARSNAQESSSARSSSGDLSSSEANTDDAADRDQSGDSGSSPSDSQQTNGSAPKSRIPREDLIVYL